MLAFVSIWLPEEIRVSVSALAVFGILVLTGLILLIHRSISRTRFVQGIEPVMKHLESIVSNCQTRV